VIGHTSGKLMRKKYALLDKNNNLTIRGFEAVRRDWSNIAKETQEMDLMTIVKENSLKKAEEIIKDAVERLKSGDVDMDDLVIKNQLTKSIEQYDQAWPHVSAARKLAVRGGTVTVGSSINYIITSIGLLEHV
jgi:DNA polymerase I